MEHLYIQAKIKWDNKYLPGWVPVLEFYISSDKIILYYCGEIATDAIRSVNKWYEVYQAVFPQPFISHCKYFTLEKSHGKQPNKFVKNRLNER